MINPSFPERSSVQINNEIVQSLLGVTDRNALVRLLPEKLRNVTSFDVFALGKLHPSGERGWFDFTSVYSTLDGQIGTLDHPVRVQLLDPADVLPDGLVLGKRLVAPLHVDRGENIILLERKTGEFSEADLRAVMAIVRPAGGVLRLMARVEQATAGQLGVLGPGALESKLTVEVSRALRYHRPVGLLVIECVGLTSTIKLISIGQTVRQRVRISDAVGILSDSQVGVIVLEAQRINVGAVAIKLESVIQEQLGSDGRCAIGGASAPQDGTKAADLLSRARFALSYAQRESTAATYLSTPSLPISAQSLVENFPAHWGALVHRSRGT